MSLARLVIAAVRVDGRSKSEVARDYEVSRYWVQQLVRRFETEGEAAYQPRSRRPHHSPNAVPARLEDQIIRLRKELSKAGPGRRRRRSGSTSAAAPRDRCRRCRRSGGF
jgi:transposase-like protein